MDLANVPIAGVNEAGPRLRSEVLFGSPRALGRLRAVLAAPASFSRRWGRVLGTADDFAPGDRTLVAQIPVGHVPTLYARIGDAFAWMCVAAALVGVLLSLRSRG